MTTISRSAPIAFQFPTTVVKPELEREVAAVERSARVNRIARIILGAIAAAFAVASIVLGFVAFPLIAFTIPAAILFFSISLSCKPVSEPGLQFGTMREVLNTKNQPELVQRYGKCCQKIFLDTMDPGIKLSALKEWVLAQCGSGAFKQRIDAALPINNPNAVVSTGLLESLGLLRNLNDLAFRYDCSTDPVDRDVTFAFAMPDQVTQHWKREQNAPFFNSYDQRINPENVAVLIAATKGVKNVSLGTCINPEIARACATAGVEVIQLERNTPIFEKTAKELVASPTLKQIRFSSKLASAEARALMEKHFKPESARNLDGVWTKK